MEIQSVTLFSGGMDSFLVWALHDRTCLNLFVDIGHKYARKELDTCSTIANMIGADFQLACMKGAQIGKYELPDSGIIPFRNAELVLCAAQHSPIIYMGVTAHEINSDKSPTFMKYMEYLLDESYKGQYWNNNQPRHHRVTSPLRDRTKAQLVAQYLETGDPVEWLLATVSCYDAGRGHCGACPSCFKRWVALKINGLQDSFKRDPRYFGEEQGILDKCTDGTYHPERAEEILKAYNL